MKRLHNHNGGSRRVLKITYTTELFMMPLTHIGNELSSFGQTIRTKDEWSSDQWSSQWSSEPWGLRLRARLDLGVLKPMEVRSLYCIYI